ncbi:MAG: ABC transporter permease subunit [Oscillospiraceae bacterium]|nr:ABC transporter permease subunit [Oscillospiraceae bacterium]
MSDAAIAESKKKTKNSKAKQSIPKTFAERVSDVVYVILRIAVIGNVCVIFFPNLNPARLSGLINKNLSLFSCGISYNSIVANFGRTFRMGWAQESTFHSLHYCAMLIILMVIVAAAGGCMSLGNNKLKRFGLIATVVAGAGELVSMAWLKSLYTIICNDAIAADKVDKVSPQYPATVNYIYMALAIVLVVCSLAEFFLVKAPEKDARCSMEPKFQLFLMMLPIIALAFVFSYLPLYGWRYAFFDYKSGETLSMDNFVGFKWFTSLLQNSATKRDIVNVLKNTFAMSGLGILTSWIPMAFAVFLSEIKNTHFRRVVQTITTIPNFISWVLVYAIALAIFSTDGFINTMINSVSSQSVATNYLMSDSHMWLKMLAWGLWKGVGWSAIIYIASISGIDQGLYEAATVDGAGRFAKMWYITIPELIPTYCVLLLMSIANILSNGMDQYLVFENAINSEKVQVLDLYVYTLGINSGLIPLSTVIGMLKSIISVALLFAANGISKLIRGESIV